MNQKVLMGGAGSTGSSMLRQLLNRHSEIVSGGELNFFNKVQIYEDWPQAVAQILKKKEAGVRIRPFTTDGWFPYPGHNLFSEDYVGEKDQVEDLLKKAKSLEEFVDDFFKRPLEASGASTWIEKTPSNSYAFAEFLERFPDGKVIQTVRDPYDAVASLVRRGFSPVFAAGMWVYNSSAALSVAKSSRYHSIRYEDLVVSPEQELEKLLLFLKLRMEPEMLEAQGAPRVKNPGWMHDASSGVSKGSVGGFGRMDEAMQEEIITGLEVFEIRADVASKKGYPFRRCSELCRELGYQFRPSPARKRSLKIRFDLLKDCIIRTRHNYLTGFPNFPARIFF